MKILFLTPWGYDFLPDQLYTGLCKLLGWEAVVDFPWKPEYHDPDRRISYLPQNPGRSHEVDEVTTMLERREFDLVVLTAQRRGTVESHETFASKVNLPPMAFVDSSDSPEMNAPLFRRLNGGLYFKREYKWMGGSGLTDRVARWRQFGWDRDLLQRTYPLQMSAILETVPVSGGGPRDVDVSFNGFVSNRQRIRAVNLLKRARDIRFEGDVYADTKTRRSKVVSTPFQILRAKLQSDPYLAPEDCGHRMGYEEHYQLLHRSKMGLSLAGGGFDTMRYWEVVAAKTLLVSVKPSIYIPNNFEHGKHAIFCRPDLSDLVPLVKKYARDDEARESIAMAGYEHLLKFHTCEQRARQFLDVCQASL